MNLATTLGFNTLTRAIRASVMVTVWVTRRPCLLLQFGLKVPGARKRRSSAMCIPQQVRSCCSVRYSTWLLQHHLIMEKLTFSRLTALKLIVRS